MKQQNDTKEVQKKRRPGWATSLTERMLTILLLLVQMPFASVSNLAARHELRGSSRTAVNDDLQWLYKGDYVGRVERGWSQKARRRYYSTTKGIDAAMDISGEPLEWGVTETALKRLLRQGQLVEMLYDTAPRLFGSNAVDEPWRHAYPLVRLRWLSRGPVAAVAEYQLNFIGDPKVRRLVVSYTWYGLRPKPNPLPRESDRWLDGAFTSRETRTNGSFWHCGVVVLAADRLSGLRARRDLPPDIARAIITVDGSGRLSTVETMYPSIPPAVMITAAKAPADPGRPERIETHLQRDLVLANTSGCTEQRILSAIEEWPGCRVGQLARLCGHPASAVRKAAACFVEAGLVDREADGAHYPTEVILKMAEDRDRLGHRKTRGRAGAELSPGGGRRAHMSRHESGVIELAIRFRREGFCVAAGWRMVDNHGGRTQVSPDLWALVPLGDGRGLWHAVEYERSATKRSAIERKLRPYRCAMQMGEGQPVLMVCETAAAAAEFAAQGWDLPMSVAVYREALERPWSGQASPWRHGGEKVDVDHLCRMPLWSREKRDRCEYFLVESIGHQL